MRQNYWSCTSFANWVLGVEKPKSETWEGWATWKTKMKAERPIRYWISQELLDDIQDIVMWPKDKVNNISYYIANRWISHSNALIATSEHIKPGQWCDLSHRVLVCNMDALVDFVEIECAWMHVAWEPELRKEFNFPKTRIFRRMTRCPEAGKAYLEWAASLVYNDDYGTDPAAEHYGKPTPQAEGAMEILALYRWWTEVYPNRPDIYDVSGWSAYCDKKENILSTVTDPEEIAERDAARKKVHELEEAYFAEEEEMLIRLVKVRHHLWT
jgi:hypothetical protein